METAIAITFAELWRGAVTFIVALAALTAALGVLGRLPPVRWLSRQLFGDPIATWFRREVAEVVDARVGTPNGKGNVIEMLDRTLVAVGGINSDVRNVQAEVDAIRVEQDQHRLDDEVAFADIRARLGEGAK